ncbi:PREDICTED: uncharacterized protein LOC106147246 isoform X4 [Chinchilla lanigera]|uniref:uncharacterized protein LOC106147246 isoform X4 n=1 Tax=Chinchilla lanigera TaxID=34839 RepID=UPI0006984697|nr:PREDICTED: uncharacterized protein LOC106147246 isoform X4 [Chinchilla lanigera]
MIASRTPHPQTEAESPPAEGVRTHSPHLPRRSSTKVAGGSDGRTTPVPAPRSPAARWRPRVGPRLPLGELCPGPWALKTKVQGIHIQGVTEVVWGHRRSRMLLSQPSVTYGATNRWSVSP